MSRNFGIGTRDLASAGRQWLSKSGLSFSSISTLGSRWEQFASFSKENGVGRMERVTPELVREYAANMKDKDLSNATKQNYVSAINTVMKSANIGWKSVDPVRDCDLEKRSTIRETAPVGIDREKVSNAIESLRMYGNERAASIVELAREFGLRVKESSLLDNKSALREAQKTGQITITKGTKGGRVRIVTITNTGRQLSALKRATDVQGKGHCLIPNNISIKTFINTTIKVSRDTIKEYTGESIRDLRSSYACERYTMLTGHPAPAVVGHRSANIQSDRQAREIISRELGHGRIEVISEYIGSAK